MFAGVKGACRYPIIMGAGSLTAVATYSAGGITASTAGNTLSQSELEHISFPLSPVTRRMATSSDVPRKKFDNPATTMHLVIRQL
jgi:hypothetical protein